MENKLQLRNQGLASTTSILPAKILNEQPDKKAVQMEIVGLLERLVIVFQIQNWTEKNGIVLSEWIMDNYKFDQFEVVRKTLLNPPDLNDQVWRLTPDTIRNWMACTLDKQAEAREKELSKEKQKTVEFEISEDLKPETKKMIQDYLDSLSGPKTVQAMTDKDIKKFGGDRPYKSHLPYPSTPKESIVMKELQRRWSNEVHDKITGKKLDNWISFEEWQML